MKKVTSNILFLFVVVVLSCSNKYDPVTITITENDTGSLHISINDKSGTLRKAMESAKVDQTKQDIEGQCTTYAGLIVWRGTREKIELTVVAAHVQNNDTIRSGDTTFTMKINDTADIVLLLDAQ